MITPGQARSYWNPPSKPPRRHSREVTKNRHPSISIKKKTRKRHSHERKRALPQKVESLHQQKKRYVLSKSISHKKLSSPRKKESSVLQRHHMRSPIKIYIEKTPSKHCPRAQNNSIQVSKKASVSPQKKALFSKQRHWAPTSISPRLLRGLYLPVESLEKKTLHYSII